VVKPSPLPTAATRAVAVSRGWGERDSRVAMLLQEERAGVNIAVGQERIREVLEHDRDARKRDPKVS
jgi:hypothetical protein